MEMERLAKRLAISNHEISFHVHGVGAMSTLYTLSREFHSHRPELIIQCGVAGAYVDHLPIGSVVHVVDEQWGDLGAEDRNGQLIDVFELGLANDSLFPFSDGLMKNPQNRFFTDLVQVKGLSVNTCSGSAETISRRRMKYNPDIETMEGGAFAYYCLLEDIQYVQIRGISNRVEPRNKEAWNIPLAVENYSTIISKALEEL